MLILSVCLSALFTIILSDCPSNSKYATCPNPVKQTCANLYDSSRTMILKCTPGCKCNPDYVFTPDGKECVKITDCKPEDIKCPANQEYRECSIHNICGSNRTVTHCKPGCFCKYNLYFDDLQQNCVMAEDCVHPQDLEEQLQIET